MENLSISEPQGGMAAPPAQLPPQMFTTAAQLLDLTDSMILKNRNTIKWEGTLTRGLCLV